MMRISFFRTASAILLLLTGRLSITAAADIVVWPVPSYYSSGDKVLWIAEDVVFTYEIVLFYLSTSLEHWVLITCL